VDGRRLGDGPRLPHWIAHQRARLRIAESLVIKMPMVCDVPPEALPVTGSIFIGPWTPVIAVAHAAPPVLRTTSWLSSVSLEPISVP
jgi:hypothetical protein